MDIKESNISIVYRIKEGDGGISGANGEYNFKTSKEATEEAVLFKENPRSHNKNMTDESVKYWQSRNYRVEKVITIVEIIKEI